MVVDGKLVRAADVPQLIADPPGLIGFSQGRYTGPDLGYDNLLVRRPTESEYKSAVVPVPTGSIRGGSASRRPRLRAIGRTKPGTVLWRDNFQTNSLARYSPYSPSRPENWKVRDGVLRHKDQRRVGGQEDLFLPFHLTGDAVMEVTVVPKGQRVKDADLLLGSVSVVYGGNDNRQSWIRELQNWFEPGGRSNVHIPKDRPTRMRLARIGPRVTFSIDGKVVRATDLPQLLHDPPGYVGFTQGAWLGADVAYDDLLVRRPTLAEYKAAGVKAPQN